MISAFPTHPIFNRVNLIRRVSKTLPCLRASHYSPWEIQTGKHRLAAATSSLQVSPVWTSSRRRPIFMPTLTKEWETSPNYKAWYSRICVIRVKMIMVRLMFSRIRLLCRKGKTWFLWILHSSSWELMRLIYVTYSSSTFNPRDIWYNSVISRRRNPLWGWGIGFTVCICSRRMKSFILTSASSNSCLKLWTSMNSSNFPSTASID